MKSIAIACLCAGLLCAQGAAAMTLNPRGTGQVLIFPYFTVNKHQQTLISVTNTTPNAKVLQVRFREGYNGRDVLDFHIYLSAHDTWTGTVFSLADAGLPGSGAALVVDDTSCTVPILANVNPQLPGRSYQPFLSYAYIGNEADSGPTDDARTREGFLEIIEMAEVTGATRMAVTPVNGTAPNCATLAHDPPAADLVVPGGGLTGTEAIIDVAQGTLFSANAYAIDGFTNRTLYYPVADIHPNLGDASTSATGFVSASVPIGGGYMQLDYPPEQAIDAVSAVLMAAQIFTAWDNTPSSGAQTDLLVTLPTKHFYTDAAQAQPALSEAIPPFIELFGQYEPGRSAALVGKRVFNRAGSQFDLFGCGGFPTCPPTAPAPFIYATQVLTFANAPSNDPSGALGARLTVSMWPRPFSDAPQQFVGMGTASIYVKAAGAQLRADAHGSVLHGLPVAGFTAIEYTNANVTPGVLANYSGAEPLRTALECDSLDTLPDVPSPCITN
jgi:hypothetical protein